MQLNKQWQVPCEQHAALQLTLVLCAASKEPDSIFTEKDNNVKCCKSASLVLSLVSAHLSV